MKKRILFLFLVVGMIGNCASLGAPYVKSTISKDQALVVIYRSSAYVGWASSFDIKHDGKVITSLKNGGYFSYYVKPGKVKLIAETLENKSEVDLDLKGGQTVYVKGAVKMGAVAARAEISLVGDQFGEEEASKCKEIPPQN